jgi:hypothetical protein
MPTCGCTYIHVVAYTCISVYLNFDDMQPLTWLIRSDTSMRACLTLFSCQHLEQISVKVDYLWGDMSVLTSAPGWGLVIQVNVNWIFVDVRFRWIRNWILWDFGTTRKKHKQGVFIFDRLCLGWIWTSATGVSIINSHLSVGVVVVSKRMKANRPSWCQLRCALIIC